MRKLSPFAWLVIAVQVIFAALAIAIWSNRTDCEVESSEDIVEGLLGEVICDVADDLIVLGLLYALGFLWVIANIGLGIFAVLRRKRANNSVS